MKKHLQTALTLALLLATSIAFGQKLRLSGTVNGEDQGEILLTWNDSYLDDLTDTLRIEVKNSQFSVELPSMNPIIGELKYKEAVLSVFLSPNSELKVNVDAMAFPPTIAVDEKGSVEAVFLQEFNKKFAADFDKKAWEEKMLDETSVDGFEMEVFANRMKEHEFLKDYPQFANLSGDFKQYIQNRIRYNYLDLLLSFPIIRSNASKLLTVGALPNVMLEEINDTVVNNTAALICKEYQGFLEYYVVYFTSKEHNFQKFTNYDESMRAKYAFARQNLKEEQFLCFITQYIYANCDKISVNVYKEMLATIEKEAPRKGYYNAIDAHCKDQIKPIVELTKKEDKKATETGFKLVGLNGKEISLGDFKGKVVYIDFWASWCGPCRSQFPYSKAMHDKLSKQDKKKIEFLYISIDATEDAWKQAVEQFGLQGVHGLSPGNWNSEACKYFGISSIPRYMIMDKDGKIVEPNAKRPGDESVLDQLLELAK